MTDNASENDIKTSIDEYLTSLKKGSDAGVSLSLSHISWKTRYAAAEQHPEFPEILEKVMHTLNDITNKKNIDILSVVDTAQQILEDEYVAPYFKTDLAARYFVAMTGSMPAAAPQFRKPSPFREVRAAKLVPTT